MAAVLQLQEAPAGLPRPERLTRREAAKAAAAAAKAEAQGACGEEATAAGSAESRAAGAAAEEEPEQVRRVQACCGAVLLDAWSKGWASAAGAGAMLHIRGSLQQPARNMCPRRWTRTSLLSQGTSFLSSRRSFGRVWRAPSGASARCSAVGVADNSKARLVGASINSRTA